MKNKTYYDNLIALIEAIVILQPIYLQELIETVKHLTGVDFTNDMEYHLKVLEDKYTGQTGIRFKFCNNRAFFTQYDIKDIVSELKIEMS